MYCFLASTRQTLGGRRAIKSVIGNNRNCMIRTSWANSYQVCSTFLPHDSAFISVLSFLPDVTLYPNLTRNTCFFLLGPILTNVDTHTRDSLTPVAWLFCIQLKYISLTLPSPKTAETWKNFQWSRVWEEEEELCWSFHFLWSSWNLISFPPQKKILPFWLTHSHLIRWMWSSNKE